MCWGEGGRKFVTSFNIRNSFTWVVTGEQLQVAESWPKSLQKRWWDPCQQLSNGFSSWKGGGGGGEASFEKAEFGSWCIFNRIRTHELEAENSQPSSLNSQPAGRLAPRQWQESREVKHLEPGLQERSWKLFPPRRALCGLRAFICPLTYQFVISAFECSVLI